MASGAAIAGWVAAAASAASAGASMYSSHKQGEAADKQKEAREKEQRRQAELARAKQIRERRIRQAKLSSQAGAAGIGGTTVDAPMQSAATVAEGNISNVDQTTQSNIDQINIQNDAAQAQSTAGMIQGGASLVSSFSQMGSMAGSGGGNSIADTNYQEFSQSMDDFGQPDMTQTSGNTWNA